MPHTAIQNCRICGSTHLHSILHLGEQALTGVFPKSLDETVEAGPLELVKCDESLGGCGLVQLRHSFSPEKMYGQNYGYRSGLNRSMVEHLRKRVREAMFHARPEPGELVLDIGSNDGTTLGHYPDSLQRVGMDPTGVKFHKYYKPGIELIPDFFSASEFRKRKPNAKAKIVTSIAMFYDLESPMNFMQDIESVLDENGVWVFEQSYLPMMLDTNSYDTVCHEHLEYYALKQIQWMTERCGLKIVDVELNGSNGGSFCLTVAKRGSSIPVEQTRLDHLIQAEAQRGLHTLAPFEAFAGRAVEHAKALRQKIDEIHRSGQSIYGYGASTKGNVVLQYCGLTVQDLPAIAEVNEDKFGAFTPGTKIPILSETEVRSHKPDYLMVLPWHFRDNIIARETNYLATGGQLLFPLPHLDVVTKQASVTRAA
jgi:hypothetical protein